MKLVFNKLATGMAIVVLCGTEVFAHATHPPVPVQRGERFLSEMEMALNMTPEQRTTAHAAFQEARKSAEPIRKELVETRKSLQAAVQAGNLEQIQQLAATEGNQIGQLTALRSTAFAKIYKTLTPEQREKLTGMLQARHEMRHGWRGVRRASS